MVQLSVYLNEDRSDLLLTWYGSDYLLHNCLIKNDQQIIIIKNWDKIEISVMKC